MLTHVILTAIHGDLTPAEVTFQGQTQAVIGRSTGCSLRLDDPTVSRQHCLLDVGSETVWVLDLGSLNGTYVNGLRIPQIPEGEAKATELQMPHELHDGDEVRLGANAFRVGLVVMGACASPWVDAESACPAERECQAVCA